LFKSSSNFFSSFLHSSDNGKEERPIVAKEPNEVTPKEQRIKGKELNKMEFAQKHLKAMKDQKRKTSAKQDYERQVAEKNALLAKMEKAKKYFNHNKPKKIKNIHIEYENDDERDTDLEKLFYLMAQLDTDKLESFLDEYFPELFSVDEGK
jgi:hypothetical protein